MSLKFTNLRLQSNLPGANELIIDIIVFVVSVTLIYITELLFSSLFSVVTITIIVTVIINITMIRIISIIFVIIIIIIALNIVILFIVSIIIGISIITITWSERYFDDISVFCVNSMHFVSLLLGFVRTRVLMSRSRLKNGATHGGWHFDIHRDFDTRGR